MSLALLFPGQGTQHQSMLSWLESCSKATATLALVEERLGSDWRRRLADEVWASSNRVAQVLLTGLGLTPEQNPSRLHCANGVVAGHDGWLCLAMGDNGVNVPRQCETSSAARCSISMSSPDWVAQSTVDHGAAT